jgi:hypothetical protein
MGDTFIPIRQAFWAVDSSLNSKPFGVLPILVKNYGVEITLLLDTVPFIRRITVLLICRYHRRSRLKEFHRQEKPSGEPLGRVNIYHHHCIHYK